ncbi:MAG TPA: hypothetical protein VN768_06730, partial [Acidimicrobiales bacterium]|nr:hypothetical protein [Acidimicrobiales bacterium]
MEPINFRSALRRWPVVVGVALVVAVGAAFFPVKVPRVGKARYAASATIGVPPNSSSKKGTSSGGVISEIQFATNIQTVMGNAAKAAGVKESAVHLEKDLSIAKRKKTKKKSGPINTLTFSISQGTAKGSATLTNDFAKALGEYLDSQAATHQKNALAAAQQQVSSIETELNNVNEQIAQLVASGGASGGSTKSGKGGTRTNPTLADLETQSQSLTASYSQAIQKEQQIQDSPTPAVSFLIIRPALPSGAKKTTGKISSLDHHSVRGALGLGAGAVLGVGVALLLEALDRRIKTSKRAADVFDLPVVAE